MEQVQLKKKKLMVIVVVESITRTVWETCGKPAFSPGSGKRTGANKPKVSDIQKALDSIENIKVSLESKSDASFQSQEFSAKQLTDNS